MKKKLLVALSLSLLLVVFLCLCASAADHTHKGQVGYKAPTCTKSGSTGYGSCTICKEFLSNETIPALGHNMVVDPGKTQPATCENVGRQYSSCSNANCKATETEGIAPLGHAFQETTTPATCLTPGKTVTTCNHSGCSYHKEKAISPTGHNYGSFVTTLPATCEAAGIEVKTCQVAGCTEAGYKIENTLAATGHTYQKNEGRSFAATCLKDGLEAFNCANSGCSATNDNVIAAIGHHTYQKNEARSSAATCIKDGLEAFNCANSGCSETNDNVIAATGHTYQKNEDRSFAATCLKDGLEAFNCANSGCSETNDNVIPATGHSFGPIVTRASGRQIKTCSVCKLVENVRGRTRSTPTSHPIHNFLQWAPVAGDKHTSTCADEGCNSVNTTGCTLLPLVLEGEEITFCPICGRFGQKDILLPLVDADATAIAKTLPQGEVIVLYNTIATGQEIITIAFSENGKVENPDGTFAIVIPAKDFIGYTFVSISATGEETALTPTTNNDTFVFEFIFDPTVDTYSPAVVIKAIPTI